MTPEAALTKAIRLVGGHTKMAEMLGIERTAIYQWKKGVPPNRAVEIEQATGGEITREQLRPDLFRKTSPEAA